MPRAPLAVSDPAEHSIDQYNGVPACQRCGGQLGFAVAGGAIEWWRCIKCGQFMGAIEHPLICRCPAEGWILKRRHGSRWRDIKGEGGISDQKFPFRFAHTPGSP